MPIVLLVLAPKANQTVTADPEVVVYAQRMLGGIDQVAYTLTIDRRPVDPPAAHGLVRSAPASRSTCPPRPQPRPASARPALPARPGRARDGHHRRVHRPPRQTRSAARAGRCRARTGAGRRHLWRDLGRHHRLPGRAALGPGDPAQLDRPAGQARAPGPGRTVPGRAWRSGGLPGPLHRGAAGAHSWACGRGPPGLPHLRGLQRRRWCAVGDRVRAARLRGRDRLAPGRARCGPCQPAAGRTACCCCWSYWWSWVPWCSRPAGSPTTPTASAPRPAASSTDPWCGGCAAATSVSSPSSRAGCSPRAPWG